MAIGNKYLNEENYNEAIAAFNKAISIDPMNADAYLGMADAYIGLDNYDGAKNILEKGIESLKSSNDKFNDEIALLEEKLREVLSELDNRKIDNMPIIEQEPKPTYDIPDEPYIEMPFGPGDFKVGGYSLLDDSFYNNVKSILKSEFRILSDYSSVAGLNEIELGGYFYSESADRCSVQAKFNNVSSQSIIYCSEDYCNVSDFINDNDKYPPTFSSFLEYYNAAIPEIVDAPLKIGQTTYDDLSIIEDITKNGIDIGHDSYQFYSQFGMCICSFTSNYLDYPEVHFSYYIDDKIYSLSLLFDKSNNLLFSYGIGNYQTKLYDKESK